MKNITLPDKRTVTIYHSAKELPMARYSAYQKYLLFDSGVGSDLEAVTRHFEKLDLLLAHGKLPEAIEERTNLHFNLFYQLNEVNFKGLAFACLIHAIDGKEVTDTTETALKAMVKELSAAGFTQLMLEEELEELKKKLEGELKISYPEYFSDDAVVNLLSQVRQKVLLLLEYMATENDALLSRISELDNHLILHHAPQNFDLNDPANAITRHDTAFENLCTYLEDMGATDVAGLSVFRFYARVKFYDNKFKKTTA